MRGICVNHNCDRFESPVPVSDDVNDAETDRCSDCGQLLCHESGLTFRDALAADLARRPSQTCERCGRLVWAVTGSIFNTEMICLGCDAAERRHPDYERARDVEVEYVRRGEFNFPGVGLPPELVGGGW